MRGRGGKEGEGVGLMEGGFFAGGVTGIFA